MVYANRNTVTLCEYDFFQMEGSQMLGGRNHLMNGDNDDDLSSPLNLDIQNLNTIS